MIRLFIFFLIVSLSIKSFALTLTTPSGGDFSVKTPQGRLQLKELKGKQVFLYFGFTRCPHVCPMTLWKLKKLTELLPKEKRDNLRILFVSVDSERDSLKDLERYMKAFNSNFIAGTESKRNLEEILKKFGARTATIKRPDGSVMIDHTTNVFLINAKGEWVETLSTESTVEEFQAALERDAKVDTQLLELRRAREVIELGRVSNCELSEKECSLKLPSGASISLELSTKPITTEKKITAQVKILGKYIPIEIDFEGINLNMGLIRPKLSLVSGGLYKAEFTLPVCELDQMKWNVRLILKDESSSRQYSVLYSLLTKN